jgi:uncharacterized membrane protein YidH (DUF202 family)
LIRRLWHSPTITTWGSFTVRFASVLLLLPLVLVRFAPADVAVWQLFASLAAIMLMLDFGVSPTLSRMLGYARGGASLSQMADMRDPPGGEGHADPAAAAAVFAVVRWLYPLLAIGVGVLFGIGGTLALAHPIAQSPDPGSAWVAWGVALAGSVVMFWGGSYAAALQGMNSIAPLRRWEVATGCAQIATCLLVLLAGGGLLALVAAHQAWLVIAALRNRFLLRRLHPELFTRRAARDDRVLLLIWPATWRSGIGMLMSHGLVHASGVAYSQAASPVDVASYLLGLRVVSVISQVAQAPFYSKLPRLAELQASGARAEQRALAQRGMRFAHWVFVAGVVAVALFIDPALRAIGSRTPFVSEAMWAVLAVAFFLERFGAMHLQLYTLTNHVVWHVANGVTGLLIIAIAVASYSWLGLLAFPLAMLLAYGGFYCVYSVRRSAVVHGMPLGTFERRAALPPAVALGCAVAAGWLASART